MNPTDIEPPYNPAMTGPDFKLSEGRYNATLFFTDYLCIWPVAVLATLKKSTRSSSVWQPKAVLCPSEVIYSANDTENNTPSLFFPAGFFILPDNGVCY